MFTPGSAERVEWIEAAGYNVLNLATSDVAAALDFVSDVPELLELDAFGPESGPPFDPGKEPPLQELAAALYGPKTYIPTLRGKGAEAILASVLGKKLGTEGFDVVTHGLFPTVDRQLRRNGARIEVGQRTEHAKTADLDLDWLAERLRARRCDIVYLEPCNNALGGWPVTLGHTARVRELCDRHGVLLILDATRVMGNASLEDGADVQSAARELLAYADAFTLSCAKECFAPAGAFIGVPNYEMARACFTHAWGDGMTLESLQARIDLARGIRYSIAHPEAFGHRRAFLVRLRAALAERDIPCLDPVGGHAVFVDVGALIPAEGAALRMRALEAWLYLATGVRAKIQRHDLLGKVLLRFAVRLGLSADASAVAAAVQRLFREHEQAPSLVGESPSTHLHPRLERFRRA